MGTKNQIYVLIPTYNRCELLCETLTEVFKQLAHWSARFVVVDAGSIDGTLKTLKENFPSVKIIEGNSNMWWTATVNYGIEYIAKTAIVGDRILIMNDDITFAPDALTSLLEASEIETRALIGAVNIVHRQGVSPRVHFCGGRYDLRFARHKPNIPEGTPWQEPDSRFLATDFLYGRLLVIPWEVFQFGISFDENNFPQYCADEDFSYRAKLRNFKVLVDTRCIVFVNEVTTTRFNLSIAKSGWGGFLKALTAFNSNYNLKQNWTFSRRHAKWPLIYILCKFGILFFKHNISPRR